MASRRSRDRAGLMFGLGLLAACTDAGLQPLVDRRAAQYDDQLAISGQFCTSPADEVAFPVKLLILIDQSASLQCTDPTNNRLTALDLAGAELDALPNVLFGVVGFSSWSRITDFTPDWAVARDALALAGGGGGPATDYQGSLSTALRVLEQDMVAAGPAIRARTKYMVLFISDGVPEPRCRAGCNDGGSPPDSLYGVCNYTGEIPEGVYVDMLTQCPDYNQPIQILQKIQDIVALGDYYGVGDLKLHTVFLFAPQADVEARCPGAASQFGYVREEALPLMRAMAEEGNGTFRDVNISTELDFLDLDYESLVAPYELVELFALNRSSIPSGGGPLVDSDGDGLDDATEFARGLDRLHPDSDGDYYSDLFETRFAGRGFDPLDASMPALACQDQLDRDNDGLRGCEEIFLGTDPLLPDSDGDRFNDGVELRLGTDPTMADSAVDHDFDGRLSGMEIRAGTSPAALDTDAVLLRQVRYSVTPGALDADDVRCYDFQAQGLTLVPTLSQPYDLAHKGFNRILLYTQEAPGGLGGDVYWVACVEARYLGETFKDPPSGQVRGLHPGRFVELQLFDPAQHCLQPGGDPTVPLP